MSGFGKIFDVFSKRPESSKKPIHEIPETTRHRIYKWCDEFYGGMHSQNQPIDFRNEFWKEILSMLQYRLGRSKLSTNRSISTPYDDIINYLFTCRGEEFIDFIEYIFRVQCISFFFMPSSELIEEINELIRVDNLPYYLTDFVKEEVPAGIPGIPNTGNGRRINIVSYPKIIMKENEAIHEQITVPTLNFLQRPIFGNANKEYLDALEDYRKGDYGDCLTKCGSSFESVMKILCDKKKWKYNQTDSASGLVKIMIAQMGIENYFEPVLIIIATLRNKLSKSHGAGPNQREATKPQAEYALNATAAAILFLVSEAGER
ncbi:MAG: abortive infection family protein [Smithella sp.]|nr:abortive infection family protein [Smithella sp.]